MQFLNALVINVGIELLTYFKPEGIPSELKSDNTPLTIADTKADQLITEAIRTKYPNDQILSEESSLVLDSVEGSTWVIDPLDGTTNFSLGFPYWGISIARITNGFPEIDYISVLKKNDINQTDIEQKAPDIKIAILGKPNVGKSSLLNKIVDKERSIVSCIPGTTRDVVDEEFEFENKSLLILDTAGIRKKSKVNENVEYYSVNRALKSIAFADVIFLVIDSLENVSEQDKKIADQIVKNGKGLIIALNKWDLQKKIQISFNEKKEQLLFKFPILKYVPIIPVSAMTGEGIKTILKTSIKIYNELHKRIETSQLNNFIQKILTKYSPPARNAADVRSGRRV